jgi:hypothetical protein
MSALGHVASVFEECYVARHERRSGEAEDLPEGKVPGHDGQNDADGIVAKIAVSMVAVDVLGSKDALGIFGVVAAASGALFYLSARGSEGLAHLGGDEGSQLFEIRLQQSGEAAHPEDALIERFPRVSPGGASSDREPRVERFGREGVEAAKDLSGGRVERLDHKGKE